MKNILLLVHEDGGQEARLQAALDVVRALDGHLSCLEVIALPLIVSDYYTGGGSAVLLDDIRTGESRFRQRIEARLANEDISWSFEEAHEPLANAFDRHADLADLIVISSRSEGDDGGRKRSHPEHLPLRARRPMLAVPPDCRDLDVTGRAVIAWDGSSACHEAIRAAVPLLRFAHEVAIVAINRPDGAFSMHDAAAYLSRHGIGADLLERKSDGTIASALIGHGVDTGASYIVMGAYGVSETAEQLFGGVTRTMLGKCPLPLLLAH